MRKWATVIFVVVIVTALILGSSFQIILGLLPSNQQESALPYIIATGITVILANGIIAIMGWFGVSPLDFLPERTLKDTLRKRDPHRFTLTKSKDAAFLEEQAKAAKNQKQYEWVQLYCEAWIAQKPSDGDAYDMLGEALLELNQPSEAIEIGRKLIKLEPINYEGYSILGDAYSQLGDREQARKWYESALEVAPPTFRPYVLGDLARTYEALGLVNEAIQALEELMPTLDSEFQKKYHGDNLRHLQAIQARRKVSP